MRLARLVMMSWRGSCRSRCHAADMSRDIVLDHGEWVVEMMQQMFPILICRGSAETDGMVLESAPADEKYVSIFDLETPPELMRKITRRRGDDLRGYGERCLELGAEARADWQDRHF